MENENRKEEAEKTDAQEEHSDKGKKKNLKPLFATAVILAVIGGSLFFISSLNPQNQGNPYQMVFGNETRNFRANLIEAEKVPVYPNSNNLRNVFLGGNVSKISIYYIDGAENGFYGISAMEFTIKMGLIYKYYNGGEGYTFGDGNRENCLYFYKTEKSVCFDIEALESADNISSIKSSPSSISVLLLGPPFSSRTDVRADNYTVTVEGRSFDETNRKYTDLDLAVDKLLLELMKENIA
ncbi:MAG: hypothetical protein WA139_02730 [Candidatus Aenigmatarchaeota archaeon]